MEKMLLHLYNSALDNFLKSETENILNDVSERNLCGRLGYALEALLPAYHLDGYFADPEYNRMQNGSVKTIINQDLVIVNITCDLILHSRGKKVINDNLIAIEMKKAHLPNDKKDDDRHRLIALSKDSYDGVWTADGKVHPKHVCGYHIGIYLEIDIHARTMQNEVYTKGNLKQSWIKNF